MSLLCSANLGNVDMDDDDPYMQVGAIARLDRHGRSQRAKQPESQEAAEGLSKALGPRWDKKVLEAPAPSRAAGVTEMISQQQG